MKKTNESRNEKLTLSKQTIKDLGVRSGIRAGKATVVSCVTCADVTCHS